MAKGKITPQMEQIMREIVNGRVSPVKLKQSAERAKQMMRDKMDPIAYKHSVQGIDDILGRVIGQKGTSKLQQASGTTAEALRSKITSVASEAGAGVEGPMGKVMGVGEKISETVGKGTASIEKTIASKFGGGPIAAKAGKLVAGGWTWLLPLLLGMYAEKKINEHGQDTMANQQIEDIQLRRKGISPENEYYQSMMPAAQADTQMSQEMLMRVLTGAGGVPQRPQLAQGEEMIGGPAGGPSY